MSDTVAATDDDAFPSSSQDDQHHNVTMADTTTHAIISSSSSPQHDRHTQCCEGRVANAIIRVTQGMLWTPLAVLWIILVVVVGAIFFFFMIGAIPLGDEEKEEKWLNYSIQALNVLFTYAAVANQPKRLRDFIRLLKMPKDSVGVDWEGNVSSHIFDYVPYKHRMFVVVNLNLNCIFQFINQAFRIVYFTPELANAHVLEVNLFFALSFLCAIVAPIHEYRMEQRVRKEGRAPPGQELDPFQKFMGRADYSYRELSIESYQYAMMLLKKRVKRERMEHEKEKDDTITDRTAAVDVMEDSQMSLQVSQVELGTNERQDDALVSNESKRNSVATKSTALQGTDIGTTDPLPSQVDSPV